MKSFLNCMRRVLLAAAFVAAGGTAHAVVISSPINYTTANLVGTADPGTNSANVDSVRNWANAILALPANTSSDIYRTHATDDYTGTVAGGIRVDTGNLTDIAAGWQYVMAKYDGQNAGYVLFYLGGEASTIPSVSNAIWTNGQGNGYGISGYTLFNSTGVPEPMTLSLLGLGLAGLALRRPKKKL